MNLLNVGISRISAVMLMCAMLCFALLAQAQSAAASVPSPASAPPFDHSKTGFVLKDVHYTLKCEQCHVDGIFKNTPKKCSGCHATGTRVAATPRPNNHVPLPANSECDTCHTSDATFLVKNYNHVGVIGNCATCHNGQSLGVLSKPATHFPTVQPCEACHTNTVTFANWRMDHTAVIGGCATCHSGQFPNVAKTSTLHVPLNGRDCGACHASPVTVPGPVTFFAASFDHLSASPPVAGICNTCHVGGYQGVSTQSATHIATGGAQCDTCHTRANTNDYHSWLGAPFNHTPAPIACANCHNGTIAQGKSATHIVTALDCVNCHTGINTSNYATWLGASYGHSPAPTTCSNCHNGTIASGKSSNHLATALDCISCHTGINTSNYQNWLGAVYTHSPAPATCQNCHNGTIATGKNSTTHVVTSADCNICHINTASYSTWLGATYSHTPTPTACASCHNGVSQTGPSSTHMPTAGLGDCIACHTVAKSANFTTWLGALYSHSPVPAVCSTCHNGIISQGKLASHVATAQECGTAGCHDATRSKNFTTFLNAGFNHVAITTTCKFCHDGVQATGMATLTSHIPIGTLDCVTCHTAANTSNYTSFLGASFNHTPAPAACAGCHNGSSSVATGKPSNHIPTTAWTDCISCHTASNTGTYTSWLGAVVPHTTLGGMLCATCHNGTNATGQSAKHIPLAGLGDCGTCHTQTTTSNFVNWLGAVYSHSPAPATCQNCHNGTNASGLAAYPAHIPITGLGDCLACHTALNTSSFTTWLGATYSHNPVPATCQNCHNGTYATGKASYASHVVTSADCISCHTQANTSNFANWLGASGYDHSLLTTTSTCVSSSCHNGVAAKGVSSGHIPLPSTLPSSCGNGCHALYNGGSVISFAPGTMVHKLYTAARCDSCHNGSYTGQGIHGAIAKMAGLGSGNHIPTTTIAPGQDCTYCHTSLTAATVTVSSGQADWAPEVMNHSGTTTGCTACHEATKGYYLSSLMKIKTGHNATKVCNSCHKQCYYSNWSD